MLDDLLNALPVERFGGYPRTEGCVLIVPGRYWAGHEPEIAEALSRYRWVLLCVTSDEESLFTAGKIAHPNMRVWQQTPRQGWDYGDSRFFGVGYSPHAKLIDKSEKLLNVFLSAQDTHQRRHDCFDTLEGLRNSRVHRTNGFTKGLEPAEYARCCGLAKIMPCPSGAVSPDSFRVWEALEAGALPVVDTVSPTDGVTDYWSRILGDVPFPLVTDWADVSYTDLLNDFPRNAVLVADWYRGYKQKLSSWLREDLNMLGAL